MTYCAACVNAIIAVVAAYDILTGIRLIASPRPHLVNGRDTLWAAAAPSLLAADASDSRALMVSLYRRLGAFSLHTGTATLVWAWVARDSPVSLLALLVTYTITGLAFFAGDRRYFRGTRYFALKQLFGALWTVALALQIVAVTRG